MNTQREIKQLLQESPTNHKKMLKPIKILLFFSAILLAACSKSITKNIENPFGFCQYNGGLLISNWNQSDYALHNNKLNKKNGFISYLKNGKNRILIKKGDLFLPTGMAVKEDYLFVADLNRIVIFDLKNDNRKVDEIYFQQEEILIPDLLVAGNALFIAVRNLNKIYILNIENPENIDHSSLLPYIEIHSPSALLMSDYHLFISTNSIEDKYKDENSIFIVDDLSLPAPRKLTHHSTLYQGMTFSADRMKILFTDYANHGQTGSLTFETGEISYQKAGDENSCFTDLVIFDSKLYISDLINKAILVIGNF
jgi:hypothetical protein